MDENERYEQVCKPSFENSNKKLDKILYLLEGNGKPGLLTRVDRVEQSIMHATGVIGWITKNWQLVAVLILVAANFIGGGKKITPEEIKDISQQIKQLYPQESE